MEEKTYRSSRASGIAIVSAILAAMAMSAMEVPYLYLVILCVSIYITVFNLVRLNDKREAEWQKKADEKARELKAKRLREGE